MKHVRLFCITYLVLFIITYCSCGSSKDDSAFSDDPEIKFKVDFIYPDGTQDTPTSFPLNGSIIALFNKDVDFSTVTSSTFRITQNGSSEITGTPDQYDKDKRVIIYNITSPIQANNNYKITLENIRSTDGDTLQQQHYYFISNNMTSPNPLPVIKSNTNNELQVRFIDSKVSNNDILINSGTIHDSLFSIRIEGESDTIACETYYDITSRILYIWPTETLLYKNDLNETIHYLLQINEGICSIYNAEISDYTIPFELLTGKQYTAQTSITDNWFGYSVSVGGTGNESTIVVGAPYKTSVGGDSTKGSAYVFRWNTVTQEYEQIQQLVADDAIAYGHFGISVAINGTGENATIFIGASNSLVDSIYRGAVYIFTWDSSEGMYTQTQKLFIEDTIGSDSFGNAIAVSSDNKILLIGASHYDLDGKSASNHGAAYIYIRNNISGQYEYSQRLILDNATTSDCFGRSVAIGGTDGSATLLIGKTGAAYSYHYDEELHEYQLSQQFIPNTATSVYGSSLAINGTGEEATIFIGDPYTQINSHSRQGSVYVYKWNSANSEYSLIQQLIYDDGISGGLFGQSISLFTGVDQPGVLIGASGENKAFLYDWNYSQDEYDLIQQMYENDSISENYGGVLATDEDGTTFVIGTYLADVVLNNDGAVYIYYTY